MGATPSLADRLATAGWSGDLPSVEAAIADGASVNEEGLAPGWTVTLPPLAVAAFKKHDAVVVWLLSHGADPNGSAVMYHCIWHCTADMLQVLIDTGGDVNVENGGERPLFTAVRDNSVDKVRVLLAQPSLDLAITNEDGAPPDRYARDWSMLGLADMIAQEVSGEFL